MIVLRAFPLSLSIFWRFLIVLPVLLIALAFAGFTAFLVALILALLLPPVIVWVLTFGFFMGILTLTFLVGTRMGLTCKDYKPLNGYGGLAVYAGGYGLVIGLASMIIFSLLLVLVSVSLGLSFSELGAAQSGPDAIGSVLGMRGFGIGMIVITAAFYIVPWCIYAAFLMPMAASSIGRDVNGDRHTPFAGFGHGFVPLIVLIALAQIINFATVFGASLVAIPVLGPELSTAYSAITVYGVTPHFTQAEILYMVAYVGVIILAALWTISLQCAGAVLVYTNDHDDFQTAKKMQYTPEPAAAEDISNLWRSRMPTPR